MILGFSNDEGHPGAPGDIRAFDAPHWDKSDGGFTRCPGREKTATTRGPPKRGSQRGGANAWGGLTLDEANGILLCGTGSAGADFYGADRAGCRTICQLHAGLGCAHGPSSLALSNGPSRHVGP